MSEYRHFILFDSCVQFHRHYLYEFLSYGQFIDVWPPKSNQLILWVMATTGAGVVARRKEESKHADDCEDVFDTVPEPKYIKTRWVQV